MFRMSQIPKDRYDEVMSHLDSSQGNDLKSLLMEALQSKVEDKDKDPSMDGSQDPMMGMDKPKGIAIEKVSVMKKPNPLSGEKGDDDIANQLTKPDDMKMGDDQEMSDDELKELLSKYLS